MKRKGLHRFLTSLPASTVLWLMVAACTVTLFLLQLYFTGADFHRAYCRIAWYNPVIALCDTALILAPFWLLPARWRAWSLAPMWLVALWCFATTLYCFSFNDIMPLRSFTYVSNVNGVLLDSTLGNVVAFPPSLLLLLLPAVVTVVYWVGLRRPIAAETAGVRPWLAVLSVLPWAACQTAYPYYLMVRHSPEFTIDRERGLAMARDRFEHRLGVFYRGAVATAAADVARMLPHRLSAGERERVQAFISDGAARPWPGGTANSGKNLIILLVESLNAWAVDLEIDGKPVAPTLRRLTAPDSALVSRRMIMQACNGRSSDGLFIYMTGLLPMREGAVVMDYPEGGYPSLARIARQNGYRTTGEVTYSPGTWNVEKISREYGLDSLICFPEQLPGFGGDKNLADEAIMGEAFRQAAMWRQPFMMVAFNYSTHTPYNDFPVRTWITASTAFTPAVRVYLEKLHYFDCQLALLLDRLRAAGLLDNSVLVIVSDHTDLVDNDAAHGRPSLSPDGNDCLFAIVGGGVAGELPGYMGQVDVFPTILDVMGLNSDWRGLGTSVLSGLPPGTAVAPSGRIYGSPLARDLTERQRSAWDVSEQMITSGWFVTEGRE